ncbi:c-type cytochrome [Candidatus Lucifugimonas marina]|uniref:C-type cytochrome n=1 Tax=Candidatus Lucifugimonas marina TaxID=3038979 RepID=A0AAJ6CU34_9CHLR|nr:c-type cytochrome [SAR202 cluster bacterium JH702]MDG0869560.1 c-type cytochrome [SAR202 cluster bacterium JH639]WFG34296.1 c-type cytochrome [SAR202 cluster bacterium JH545]WFG38225.1 c-type cytochrome [SAR202 cluster bacterium JH1073]
MYKRSKFVVVSVLAVFTLFAVVACAEEVENPFGTTTPVPAADSSGSGSSEPVSSGPDLANGESKFKGLGCAGCHKTDTGKLVGPGLAGISAKGDDYILESIVDPSAVILDGYNDLMPKNFGDALKGDDMDDLIAYLNSLN